MGLRLAAHANTQSILSSNRFEPKHLMQFSLSHLLVLISGLLIGVVVVWLVFRGRRDLALSEGRAEGEVDRRVLMEQVRAATRDVDDLRARLAGSDARSVALQTELSERQREVAQLVERAGRLPEVEATLLVAQRAHAELKVRVAELSTTLDKERSQSQEKLALLNEAREQLSHQFKSLANEILDEKSKKFVEQNQVNLGHLLNPLQERIQSFQSKVEEVYVNEAKDRSALAEQVKMLTQLNNTLSLDTQNLTLALKGDRKAQGNWGEIILDEVLEKAGLLRGRHYDRQSSVKSEDGQTHVIPDVVIRLPGDGERHLVVDSKMTLPDYRAFADADTDDERQAALKRHLTSMRAHMKGLSEKNYQALYGLKSLDFVVMFVPLEPAFMLAVTNDRELFQQAWEKNILLVSPSTLLFVVRTVAYLWRQEDLSRNAKEISSRGAELYDKLVGFVHDLQRVGEKIQQAQDSYAEARKKFSEGGGNLIGQAEKLRRLGVKPSKKLPAAWTDNAEDAAAAIEADAENPDGEQL
jgi:DNA recombination protein RmuC